MEALHFPLYMRLGGAVAGVDGYGEEKVSHMGFHWKWTLESTDRHSFMPINMGFTVAIVRKLTTENMGIYTEFEHNPLPQSASKSKEKN